MAVTSRGYIDQIMPGADWARAQWGLGSRYWVRSVDDVKVTPLPSGNREVTISAGYFGGWGVTDYNPEPATVQLPTVVSGTQWFLIVARRTWGASAGTSATTFAYVTVGSTPSVPLDTPRNVNFGVLDDQPLALVPVTANPGGATVGNPRDLRAIGIGKEDFLIFDDLAMVYLAAPGVRCRLGAAVWLYGMNPVGTAHTWLLENDPTVKRSLPSAVSSDVISTTVNGVPTGWTAAAPLVTEAIRDGNQVDLNFEFRRIGPAIVGSSQYGDVTDQPVAVFAAPYRPSRHIFYSGQYRGRVNSVGGGVAPFTGEFYLHPNGVLYLESLHPDTQIPPSSDPGFWHVRGHLHFTQRS